LQLSNPERVPAPTPRAVRAAVPLGRDVEVGLPRGEPGAAFHAASGSYTSTTAFPALPTCATRHAPTSRAAPTSAARHPPLAGYGVHVAAVPHPCRGDARTVFARSPLNTSPRIPLAREAQSAAAGCQWSRSASSSSRLARSLLELPYLSSCISWAFPGCWFFPRPSRSIPEHPPPRPPVALLVVVPSPFSRRSRRHPTLLAPPLGHLEAPESHIVRPGPPSPAHRSQRPEPAAPRCSPLPMAF
jgi:hypothetical protein